jgi:hypothetical protein
MWNRARNASTTSGVEGTWPRSAVSAAATVAASWGVGRRGNSEMAAPLTRGASWSRCGARRGSCGVRGQGALELGREQVGLGLPRAPAVDERADRVGQAHVARVRCAREEHAEGLYVGSRHLRAFRVPSAPPRTCAAHARSSPSVVA